MNPLRSAALHEPPKKLVLCARHDLNAGIVRVGLKVRPRALSVAARAIDLYAHGIAPARKVLERALLDNSRCEANCKASNIHVVYGHMRRAYGSGERKAGCGSVYRAVPGAGYQSNVLQLDAQLNNGVIAAAN